MKTFDAIAILLRTEHHGVEIDSYSNDEVVLETTSASPAEARLDAATVEEALKTLGVQYAIRRLRGGGIQLILRRS